MQDGPVKDPLGLRGRVIDGKYAVDIAVGEGGAAIVYRARNVAWDMPVAIKFYVALSSAPEEARGQLLAEFIQEGRLMSTLSSRSAAIVQPRDMGAYTTDDGTWLPYLVLEWLEGIPLDGVLVGESERGIAPRSLEESIKLLEPMVFALDAAHRENIAHRDIKPENMFVLGEPRGPDARIKLLDFGIAKVMQNHHGGLLHTAASATPFTPHYGAPEQFSRGVGPTGPWTDVYALALVVLEVARGGERVYRGDDYMLLSGQSRDEEHRPTPRFIGMTVSDDVEAVFGRAVAIRPQDRYATAGEFWTAMHGAVFPDAGAWTMNEPNAKSNTTAGVATPTSATISVGKAQKPRGGGSRTIIVGAAAIGALLIVSAAIFGAKSALRTGSESASGSASTPAVSATPSSAQLGSSGPSSSSNAAAARSPEAICPPTSAIVPGGHFDMGDPAIDHAGPEHRVFIDAFCLDRTEVTAADVLRCVESGACKPSTLDLVEEGPSGASSSKSDARLKECTIGAVGRESHPANCITFDEASGYCASKGMRLPTEAEWELAAAGSDGRVHPWGGESPIGRVNACGSECVAFERAEKLPLTGTAYDADDKFPGTAPVKSFPSGDTKTGISDMAGNVSEWTADWYGPYGDAEEVNPKGPPKGERRVVRGGDFECASDRLRSAQRGYSKPETRSPAIGFRCASGLLKK